MVENAGPSSLVNQNVSEVESPVLDGRNAGLLLHPTSLPGKGPLGAMGSEARNFVDFLAAAGFSIWQMLPVGPVEGEVGSPYQARSSHAGDPRLISLDDLRAAGWLRPEDVVAGYGDLAGRMHALKKAWFGFETHGSDQDKAEFQHFISSQRPWLEDFSLYMAMREEQAGPWWDWPAQLRDRQPQALAEARARLQDAVQLQRFIQFQFRRQWLALKRYANQRGVGLFGDIPIFVALDSAEVWANRELFHLDAQGQPTVVAGVPPDYFSATGQRWGNPLYRWDAIAADDYRLWVERMRTQLDLFDLIRIDHFRGFESYWEIPASEPNAIKGHWVKGPGDALFERLHQEFGKLPLVAEDLGVITPEVEGLRDRQGLPGMKILQFAFSGQPDNPYLPFWHGENSVVYTGTHDNDTTLGWWRSLAESDQAFVEECLGQPDEPMPWSLVRVALMSRSRLAIVPMQDVLALDGESRMNLPGTTEGNWQWRFDWKQVDDELVPRLRRMIWMSGRLNE